MWDCRLAVIGRRAGRRDDDGDRTRGSAARSARAAAAKAYDALVNAQTTRAAGFTTVRNLGDRDGVTLAPRSTCMKISAMAPTVSSRR
jgi:hypothetical protein